MHPIFPQKDPWACCVGKFGSQKPRYKTHLVGAMVWDKEICVSQPGVDGMLLGVGVNDLFYQLDHRNWVKFWI